HRNLLCRLRKPQSSDRFVSSQNARRQEKCETSAKNANAARAASSESPLYQFSALRLMSAITVKTKTFNNHLGFERDLLQHQTRCFVVVPKRRVCEALGKFRIAEKAVVSRIYKDDQFRRYTAQVLFGEFRSFYRCFDIILLRCQDE
ncbi:hypothetical protein, partial [Yoonia sp. R2-816]|uniref:hypothetical protein n=1 Tax=Yoonia sp. R2-816 TaxID=3342638 RepID=UPI00372C7B75